MSANNNKKFHLAGIIPIAGLTSDFNFPWHASCNPIAPNFLAIERAVLECAYAGCETIWIVCNDDMQPLVRYRLGDYINDPVWASRPQDPRASETRKEIPIFYVPVHPSDRDKRDCLSWSVLYGASTAYNVSLRISKWTKPDRYYVSFPYGVYPVNFLRDHRSRISSAQRFYLSSNGTTVRDAMYLGFTFDEVDFIEIRGNLRKHGTGLYSPALTNGMPRETLPIEERYSARFFTLNQVFGLLNIDKDDMIEVPFYFNIDNWENSCCYMSSEDRDRIKRPPNVIMDYREFDLIGEDKT